MPGDHTWPQLLAKTDAGSVLWPVHLISSIASGTQMIFMIKLIYWFAGMLRSMKTKDLPVFDFWWIHDFF